MNPKTLDECWDLCIEMWEWIASPINHGRSVRELKQEWMSAHNLNNEIYLDCFFCEWTQRDGWEECDGAPGTCPKCPGTLVDPMFGCQDKKHCFDTNPKAFYQELLRLNEERKNALGA